MDNKMQSFKKYEREPNTDKVTQNLMNDFLIENLQTDHQAIRSIEKIKNVSLLKKN